MNATIERIHQVLRDLLRTYNLHETYSDDADPWMGILVADAFAVRSTYHRTKGNSPDQVVFGRDMILPINHIADWKYMNQRKQVQMEKYLIRENSTRIDYDYRVRDRVMARKHEAFKYETPFRVTYEIFQTCTNITVTLQTGVVTVRINIRRIMPYHNIIGSE